MNIPVSLEVYKALTNRLSHEGQTYDDLLRDLLEIDSPIELNPSKQSKTINDLDKFLDDVSRAVDPRSFHSRGLSLPHGTKLRARYKGRSFHAEIAEGKWISSDDLTESSPSAAASKITGTNVNGLRFWEALRPGDTVWRRLELLGSK